MTEALKDVPRLFNAVWFNSRYEGIQRKLSLKKHPEYAKNNEVRMKAFAGFKKWAFKDFSDEYVGYAALRKGGKKYSAVITGSDQLWSPAGLPTNYYNLMFVPDDTLKISIASSFGVKEIPWYQKKRTIQYLNRIEYIKWTHKEEAMLSLAATYDEFESLVSKQHSYELFETIIAKKRKESQEIYREALKSCGV